MSIVLRLRNAETETQRASGPWPPLSPYFAPFPLTPWTPATQVTSSSWLHCVPSAHADPSACQALLSSPRFRPIDTLLRSPSSRTKSSLPLHALSSLVFLFPRVFKAPSWLFQKSPSSLPLGCSAYGLPALTAARWLVFESLLGCVLVVGPYANPLTSLSVFQKVLQHEGTNPS